MRLLRSILVAAMVVSVLEYAFDCSAMATPEQSMQCCKSMHCSSDAHNAQDCCKNMPISHAPFVQSTFVRGISCSAVVLAITLVLETPVLTSPVRGGKAAHCHAPPILVLPTPAPIRI